MPTLTDWNPYYLTFSDGSKVYVPSNVRVSPATLGEWLMIRVMSTWVQRGLVVQIGDPRDCVARVLELVANA